MGAAARAAIDEGRWAALRLAVAASDVLGPEQLVRLLALEAPQGVDPFPDGLASLVGHHLARVLRAVARPRRLELLTDLWGQVCAHGAARLRRERLPGSQGRQDRTNDLFTRLGRYEEDELRARLRIEVGAEPTFVQAALWRPSGVYWLIRATRVLRDAFAATVLARLAVAAVDHGVDAALARHWHEIEAASEQLPKHEASLSARMVAGLTGLPARPGSYLRDIHDRVSPGTPLDPRQAVYVTQRLAHARDYGTVVLLDAGSLVNQIAVEDTPTVRHDLAAWAADGLSGWRGRVGYFSAQRLDGWDHQPLLADGDQTRTLGQRLRGEPDRPPADLETIGDLVWYAELADALAQLHGHPAAVVTAREYAPLAVVDPRPRLLAAQVRSQPVNGRPSRRPSDPSPQPSPQGR